MAYQQGSPRFSMPVPNLGIRQPPILNGTQEMPIGHRPVDTNAPSPIPGNVPLQPSPNSSNSSYSVLSYQTSNSSNNGYMNVFANSPSAPVPSQGMSLTDLSLEKAMEKVQELASENATLRGNLVLLVL